jgi:hypothetical protein
MDSKITLVLKESNDIDAQFLCTELESAHTLLNVAEVTELETTRRRTVGNACRAYKLVEKLIDRVGLSSAEKTELQTMMADLKQRFDSEWPDASGPLLTQ